MESWVVERRGCEAAGCEVGGDIGGSPVEALVAV